MYVISPAELGLMLRMVRAAFPREASGILLERKQFQKRHLAIIHTSCEENTPFHFKIDVEEFDLARRSAKAADSSVCGCFHSHVIGPSRPSRHDIGARKKSGDLWLIYSAQQRDLKLFRWNETRFSRQALAIAPRAP